MAGYAERPPHHPPSVCLSFRPGGVGKNWGVPRVETLCGTAEGWCQIREGGLKKSVCIEFLSCQKNKSMLKRQM